MRLLALFLAAVSAFAQTLPPLVDIAVSPDWLQTVLRVPQQAISSAVDAQGNVVFATSVSSGITLPSTAIGPGDIDPGRRDIVVFKMDPQLSRVIFSVVVGGSREDGMSSMAVRPNGGVVLTGFTISSDFPITTGAGPDGEIAQYGFVLTLAPDGKLESSKIFPAAISVVGAGADGDIYIAGASDRVPATPGVYTPTAPGDVFVARLNAATLEFKFVAHLSANLTVRGMVPRPDGGVVVATDTSLIGLNSSGSQLDFETTTNLRAPTLMASESGYTLSAPSYSNAPIQVQQYALDGHLIRTLHPPIGNASQLATVAPDGTLYFWTWTMGPTYNALEPCQNNQRPSDETLGRGLEKILSIVDPSGSLRYASFTSVNFTSIAVAGTHYLYGAGYRILRAGYPYGLYRLDLTKIPVGKHVAPSCITNGASYYPGQAAPGQLMSIFGSGLGPDAGVSFQLENGRAPLSLAGTSVTVDGKPASILYTQDQQTNFVVPWSVKTQGTFPICVTRSSETACLASFAGTANPGIFDANDQAIVMRQDWTRVTKSNQPKPGEVITLWVTGLGSMERLPQDGEVWGTELNRVAVPVKVWVSQPCSGSLGCGFVPPPVPWTVEYAGSAPGMLAGILQLNLRFPDQYPTSFGLDATTMEIAVGDSGFLIPFDISNPLP